MAHFSPLKTSPCPLAICMSVCRHRSCSSSSHLWMTTSSAIPIMPSQHSRIWFIIHWKDVLGTSKAPRGDGQICNVPMGCWTLWGGKICSQGQHIGRRMCHPTSWNMYYHQAHEWSHPGLGYCSGHGGQQHWHPWGLNRPTVFHWPSRNRWVRRPSQ